MDSIHNPDTDIQTSQELDDGWSVGDEHAPLTLHSIPMAPPKSVVLSNDDLPMGWLLADESDASIGPRSPLMNPVSDEDLECFSLAELAEGTEVDMPVPNELWFGELRSIVPRTLPVAVSSLGSSEFASRTLLPLSSPSPSKKSPEPDAFSAAEPLLSEIPAMHSVKKASWWKRLTRAKS